MAKWYCDACNESYYGIDNVCVFKRKYKKCPKIPELKDLFPDLDESEYAPKWEPETSLIGRLYRKAAPPQKESEDKNETN